MEALRTIAYFPLGPFPLVFYLGLVSYALLLATGASMALPARRKRRRPLRVHHGLAYATALVATLHALLGVVARL
ncbi:MAG: hypothetical protein NZ924_01415 [Candidatus Bipolaricaulota bacterium]|nr:hypothetical protein [Candidatus Bipolaricaulota bacterium]MDW8151574.1 hypothetical protein [Candidatus Bipolaricaulota bacterium]